MNNPLCPCHNLPMTEHLDQEGKRFWGCTSNKWAVYPDNFLEEGRKDKERFNGEMDALMKKMDNFVERVNK